MKAAVTVAIGIGRHQRATARRCDDDADMVHALDRHVPSLFIGAQRNHRVDSRRAARGDQASDE